MAQPGENLGGGAVKGQGSDAGGAVPHPQAGLPAVFIDRFGGDELHVEENIIPADFEGQAFAAGFLHPL